jgi:hypothetical protein
MREMRGAGKFPMMIIRYNLLQKGTNPDMTKTDQDPEKIGKKD